MNEHVRIHEEFTEFMPHQCPFPSCGEKFRQKHKFRKHLAEHDNSSVKTEPTHDFKDFGMTFEKYEEVKVHEASIGTNEKNCINNNECSEGTPKERIKLNLGTDEKLEIDLGEKIKKCKGAHVHMWKFKKKQEKKLSYECPASSCGLIFRYSVNMRRHMNLHSCSDIDSNFVCYKRGCSSGIAFLQPRTHESHRTMTLDLPGVISAHNYLNNMIYKTKN